MLNKEQLAELESLGGLHFDLTECATVLQVDFDKLKTAMRDHESKEFLAYERGRLLNIAEVRKVIMRQANQGSSPAQKQVLEIMAATERQNKLDMTEE